MKGRLALTFVLLLSRNASAFADTTLSARAQYSAFATHRDSATTVTDNSQLFQFANLRTMAEYRQGGVEFGIHHVLAGIHSDDAFIFVESDANSLFDLSHNILQRGDNVIGQQLDRLYVTYSVDDISITAGRYAVSWGHGLAYNPFDIFNPFVLGAIDTEYKNGDDMIYLQKVLDRGHDVQFLFIPRRDEISNEIRHSASSYALKLHGVDGATDYDVLLAQHYNDLILGAGLAHDIDGVLWQLDITRTETDSKNFLLLVTNLGYSWTMYDRPVSGFAEVFINTLGLDYDNGYRFSADPADQQLISRLQRAELFTLGKRYLALGLDIEFHPLLHVAPNLFMNLDDNSSLLQISVRYDARQDLTLTAGANLTAGESNSEFAGDTSGRGQTLFIQLNAYF